MTTVETLLQPLLKRLKRLDTKRWAAERWLGKRGWQAISVNGIEHFHKSGCSGVVRAYTIEEALADELLKLFEGEA